MENRLNKHKDSTRVLIPVDIALIGTAKADYMNFRIDSFYKREKKRHDHRIEHSTGAFYCFWSCLYSKGIRGELLTFLFQWTKKKLVRRKSNGHWYQADDVKLRRQRNRDFTIEVVFQHHKRAAELFTVYANYETAKSVFVREENTLFNASEMTHLWQYTPKCLRAMSSTK